MAMDRSISALRTLRPDRDADIFWFRDDLHQPYVMSPMGMTTIQKHHAWGYHVASAQTQLPPSKGAHVKLSQGRAHRRWAELCRVQPGGGIGHRAREGRGRRRPPDDAAPARLPEEERGDQPPT